MHLESGPSLHVLSFSVTCFFFIFMCLHSMFELLPIFRYLEIQSMLDQISQT